MLMSSDSTQNEHRSGVSSITIVFIVKEIWVIECYPSFDLS